NKSQSLNILNTLVTIIQYVLVAFVIIFVFQVATSSKYTTAVLSWSSTLSYALAAAVAGMLTRRFLLWYKTNRSFVILLYALASVSLIISMALTIVFSDVSILRLPQERNQQSKIAFPF